MEDRLDFRPRSFAVVGAGPVGCIVAAFLAKGGYDVTLCDVFPELLKPVLNPGIIIEGAERFGLAQLHQLRGRVIRSSYQPYCFVFAESKSQKTIERLKALTTAKNGFELAEYDLKIRGAGELGGGKQWGISDIGMEALRNIKMVEAARTESQKIIAESPGLEKYPPLAQALKNRVKQIHFE